MKILVAEDERITRRSLQRQLEAWGHEVVAAEDGAEAWDQFLQGDFQIVVTDWDMPRVDGKELVNRIRGSDRQSYVYLIMLTGRSEKSDIVAGMDAGADDFLAKPFDKNELRVRLNAGERIIRLERTLALQNEQLSMANERMRCDLEAAARAQHDLLPKDLPGSVSASVAWYFKPCDELGGDTLNVVPLDDRHIAVYLMDVSGHGVPAALLSVTLSRILTVRDPASSILFDGMDENGSLRINSPHAIAAHLNRQFPMECNSNHYFTMSLAVLDTQTGILRYTIAGHPPLILTRRGEAPRLLSDGGPPIGILPNIEFEAKSIRLEPGDRVWFYSDGITEATNKLESMLTIEGLVNLTQKHWAGTVAEDLSSLVADFRGWCGDVPVADDVSLLALEIPHDGS